MNLSQATTAEQQQSAEQNTTVEEIKFIFRRLKRRVPDFCPECKVILKEAIN